MAFKNIAAKRAGGGSGVQSVGAGGGGGSALVPGPDISESYRQVPVKYLQGSQGDIDGIEPLARAIVDSGMNVRPIIVEQNDFQNFTVLKGNKEYQAGLRAREIDPKIGEFSNVIIVNESNKKAILEQSRILDTVNRLDKQVVLPNKNGSTYMSGYKATSEMDHYQIPVRYLGDTPKLSAKEEKIADRLARSIVQSGGMIQPILVTQNNMQSYHPLGGRIQIAAIEKAKKLSPKTIEMVRVVIVPPDKINAATRQ